MRSHIRTATVVLALGLVVSACSDAEEPPAPAESPTGAAQEPTEESTEQSTADEDHGTHGDHSAHGNQDHDAAAAVTGPVTAYVLGTSTGTYGPLGDGLGSATNTLAVEGGVTLVKDENGTQIATNVSGLLSGAEHPAHLHDGSCTDFGGHYMHDHTGPAEPPNEIWLSSSNDPVGSLEPSQTGTAVGAGGAGWLTREQPLSMMIHDSEFPGLPIACADFAAYTGPVTLVLEATADGIDALEYSVDGGDWQAYDGAVEITEPGTYTVAVAGTDAAGERSEAQEITFTVAAAR